MFILPHYNIINHGEEVNNGFGSFPNRTQNCSECETEEYDAQCVGSGSKLDNIGKRNDLTSLPLALALPICEDFSDVTRVGIYNCLSSSLNSTSIDYFIAFQLRN